MESHFLTDSHDTIKKLGDYVGSLTRLTSSEPHGNMGEYLFDKHTLWTAKPQVPHIPLNSSKTIVHKSLFCSMDTVLHNYSRLPYTVKAIAQMCIVFIVM